MMIRALILLLVLPTHLLWAQPWPSVPIQVEARRILANATSAAYTHDTTVDESAGSYHFDCSGFLDYALPRSAPDAWDEFNGWAKQHATPGFKRPLAKHFVSFFDAVGAGTTAPLYWSSLKEVTEIQAGDLIAWLTPDDIDSTNTGHVMMADESPQENPRRPGEWIVTVIDSSSSGHGPGDPRKKNGPNGIGRGTIGLVVDGGGAPVAYRWSGLTSAVAHQTDIRLGRANP